MVWSDDHRSGDELALAIGDPNTGEVRRIPSVGESDCRFCRAVLVYQDEAVLSDGSTQTIKALAPSGTLRTLGPGVRVGTTASGDLIYVSTDAASTLELWNGTGDRVGGPWSVPDGYTLSTETTGGNIKAVVGGVLVQTDENDADHTLAVWQPDTGAISEIGHNRWDVIDTYTAPGAATSTIAWVRGGCETPGCDLALTDTATGTTRIIPAPARHFGYFHGGAFSPDGSKLAAFASTVGAPVDPGVELTIVDTATGDATRITNSHLDVGEPLALAAWSPSGDWLFFSSYGDPLIHRSGTKDARPLPFRFDGATPLGVLPRQ